MFVLFVLIVVVVVVVVAAVAVVVVATPNIKAAGGGLGGAEPPQFFFALKLLYLFTFHLKRFRAASFPASFGVVFVLLSRIYEQDSPPAATPPYHRRGRGGRSPRVQYVISTTLILFLVLLLSL